MLHVVINPTIVKSNIMFQITLYWNFDIPEVRVDVGAVGMEVEEGDVDAQSAGAAALRDHRCNSGEQTATL